MTDIRALAQSATPGPWRVGVPDDRHAIYVSHIQDDGMWVTVAACPDPADAALICALRNGIEALLDEAAAAREAQGRHERLVLALHQHAPSPLSHGLVGVWCGCGWSTVDDGGLDWIDHVLDDARRGGEGA